MEAFETLMFVILAVLALFGLLGFFTTLFQGLALMISEFYYNRIRWGTSISRERYVEINRILSERIAYYRNLSLTGKAKFINRLVHFISTKRFVGKEELEVTDEMRILISASAVMLTFGLDKYVLSHYTTIIVYPEKFFSEVLKRDLKGATFGNNIIALSWKDILQGFQYPHDKYNLGLHEMAHALKLDVLLGNNADEQFAKKLHKWKEAGIEEFVNMKNGEGSFLRSYGGTNEHEFFAVSVEHFFEAPEQFRQRLPELFNDLCNLLNQDPSNIRGDYSLKMK